MRGISVRWFVVPGLAGFLLGVGAFAYNATLSAAPAQGLAEVARTVSGGGIIHSRDEVYRRHGPATVRILDTPSIGVLPEAHSVDVWTLFDAAGQFVATVSAVRDSDGRSAQRGIARDGEYFVENLLTGVVQSSDFTLPPADSRAQVSNYVESGAMRNAAEIDRRLREEGWTRMVDPAGRIHLTTIEPAAPQASANGWNLPYTADLDAEALTLEHVFTPDYEFVSETRAARLDNGDEVIVESRRVQLVEALAPALWPEIVAGLFPAKP